MDTEKYKEIISTLGTSRFLPNSGASEQLRIYPAMGESCASNISVYYAPFDDVNKKAKVVLLGITHGLAQMLRACRASAEALETEDDCSSALSEMKRQSSFKDDKNQMRPNIFRQFDHWGVTEWLGLARESWYFPK
ncbi:hypothetical protein HYO37_15155 [Vibrio parahaemolyticus]|nr:hypothetical protein [Vibrio parahaemolyticus]